MRVSTRVKHIFHFSLSPKRTKGKGVDQEDINVCYCAEVEDAEMAVSEDESYSSDLQGGGVCSRKSRPSASVRVVSWASIARAKCRWTREQERELIIAEHELARCQAAWSSEQELWLTYIKALEEEKEAHQGFLHHRAKQSDDEQQNFRKAWNRRKSGELETTPITRNDSRFGRLRRSVRNSIDHERTN